MSRSVPEWIGANDDTAIPPRVRLRVFERCDGRCGQCNRKLTPADTWIVEHLTALINGGQNREGNLGITCGWCKPVKDAVDVAIKAKSARVRARHVGVKVAKRKLAGPGFPKSEPQHSATRPLRRTSRASLNQHWSR